jgi:hypothetical protein
MVFDSLREQSQISAKVWKALIALSVIWLLGCLVLLVPPASAFVMTLGGKLLHRQFDLGLWRERFVLLGAGGIVMYAALSYMLFCPKTRGEGVSSAKTTIACHIIIAAASAFIVFLIMYRANLLFGDDGEYITSTGIGKYFQLSSNLGGGRFFPLGHIHYNLPLFIVRLFGGSELPAAAHLVMIALFYAASVFFLYQLFRAIEPAMQKANAKGRSFIEDYPHLACFIPLFFIILFPFTSRSFVPVFMDLIYPETQVVMLLSIFMFAYYKMLQTEKTRYLVVALLAGIYATYCKEPMFGALIIIAAANLVFRYKKISQKERLFYFLLVANGVLFLVLYYFLSYRNATGFYNEGRITENIVHLVLSILKNTLMLIPVFVLGLIRLWHFVFKKDREHFFYDSLLFAGMGYTMAYICLGMGGDTYFLPTVILALPSFLFWIANFLTTKKLYAAYLLFPFAFICIFNFACEVTQAKDIFKQRNQFMPFIYALRDQQNDGKILLWYESDNTINDDSSYKMWRDWRKFVINTFLNYANRTDSKAPAMQAPLEPDFLMPVQSTDALGKNTIFFYPSDNDQNRPMPDELAKTLQNADFSLIFDQNGINVYQQF